MSAITLDGITYTTLQPLELNPQDDVLSAFATPAAFAATQKVSPVDYVKALGNERGQHANPTQDWYEMCLALSRTVYDIPPLFSSAYASWLGCDPDSKHVGGDPNHAPVGAALIYKGSGAFGHIMIAANPNGSVSGAWSNDLVRKGKVDYVHRTAPTFVWGEKYLGYMTEINGYELDLTHGAPPKPKQDKHYKAVEKAIERLQAARDLAKHQHDQHDRDALNKQIKALHHLYSVLRHY
jgi:hypothetical protein